MLSENKPKGGHLQVDQLRNFAEEKWNHAYVITMFLCVSFHLLLIFPLAILSTISREFILLLDGNFRLLIFTLQTMQILCRLSCNCKGC